jgi:G2/mitotic-specific cyclin 1/2
VQEQLVEAKDFGSITVEEVKEVLTTRLVKPEDEQPDDLDKDDVDDPLMVAEYVVEIFDYLRTLEVQRPFHGN